jgi:hypothetical protein
MAQPAIGVTNRDINLTGPTPADHRTIARGTVVRRGDEDRRERSPHVLDVQA